jgi:glycosyltransferase involved in cell wall biosynthesis
MPASQGVKGGCRVRVANIVEEGRLGGPQVRIADVARALQGRIETTVILPYADSEAFRERLSSYGIPYKLLPLTRLSRQKSLLLRYVITFFWEVFVLYRYLRKQGFDIVHVSGGAWQIKGVISGKLAGCKVIWHLNDTCMTGFVLAVFRCVYQLADRFILAGERVQRYYLSDLKISKPNTIIQAPVRCDYFKPGAASASGQHPAGFDGITIGTVANINPVKGIETLLDAAAALPSARKLRFLIVGPVFDSQKKYYSILQTKIEKNALHNVEFLGAAADPREFLRIFDIYVCSSWAEASPIAVWEAMAMGLPVISTDVGDVARFIQDGYNGYIVPAGDAKAMAEKISLLAADQSARVAFGSRSREIALTSLDLPIIARLHEEAYHAVLA